MELVKIPRETKLKNLPVEQKVALRLVTLANRKQNTGQLRAIAKEIGSTFKDVMVAVESLAKQGVISFKSVTANDFEFQVESANRQELQLHASNYDKHLKVQAAKLAPRPQVPPPAHLTPITEEQRAPYLVKAAELADRLNSPKVAKKIANCLARIGDVEVVGLVNQAINQATATTPLKSTVRLFFETYTLRRNVLIPPTPPLTPPD